MLDDNVNDKKWNPTPISTLLRSAAINIEVEQQLGRMLVQTRIQDSVELKQA